MAVENDAAQQKCQAIQLDKNIADAVLKKSYLQKDPPHKIQAAIQRARMANHELNKIQWFQAVEFPTVHPTALTAKVSNRPMPIRMQCRNKHKLPCSPQLLQRPEGPLLHQIESGL